MEQKDEDKKKKKQVRIGIRFDPGGTFLYYSIGKGIVTAQHPYVKIFGRPLPLLSAYEYEKHSSSSWIQKPLGTVAWQGMCRTPLRKRRNKRNHLSIMYKQSKSLERNDVEWVISLSLSLMNKYFWHLDVSLWSNNFSIFIQNLFFPTTLMILFMNNQSRH